MPVSVNVSVVDIVNLDVPQIFSNLVEKYQLEPKLLLAEITETMLAENASLVENTIQGLHEINNHLGHRSGDAMNQAEAAMRQDKQAYYARNGQERQLQTLTEKRDAEHFLRVLAPKYKSVFVVDLKTDRMRGVIVPDYFQKILDTSGGSYSPSDEISD